MIKVRFWVIFGWRVGLGVGGVPAFAAEFIEEIEKDYPLRSMGSLQVTNAKGDITVQSWAFDKIRIKLRKRVEAETAEKSKPLLAGLDYRYQVSQAFDDKIEISNQYGSNLTIEERIQERSNPKTRTDMILFAPSKLKLALWSVDGKISLKGWNGAVEARSNSGPIQMEGIKGEKVSVTCASCSIDLKKISANLRCFGKSGLINLNEVAGKSLFVETDSGGIRLSHVEGSQLYIAQSGSIYGQFLTGKIEFHANQASVDLREISGFLSGDTESGSLNGTVKVWKSNEEALIESVQGHINLALPRQFSANVDLWSIQGKTKVDFPLEIVQESNTFGPEPANHLMGRIRDGGSLLKVFSDSGHITVIRR